MSRDENADMTTKVKICGLKTRDIMAAALDGGADLSSASALWKMAIGGGGDLDMTRSAIARLGLNANNADNCYYRLCCGWVELCEALFI